MPDTYEGTGAVLVSTAKPRNQAYRNSLNQLFALASDRTVATGILHTAARTVFSMARHDGTQANAIRQGEWQQYYHDLHRGVVRGSAVAPRVPPLATLKELARDHAARRTVPIAIFNLRHHVPNKRLMTAVTSAARRDRAIRVPGNPAEMIDERRGYAVSALLPDRFDTFQRLPYRHEGLEVRFVLDPELYVTNTDDPLGTVEIDFADGLGFRPVTPGRPVIVRYATPGPRHLTVKQPTASGLLKGSFVFDVVEGAAVQPNATYPITATIPYLGKTNSGIAYVLYGSTNGVTHTQLTNPFIMSEGFPGGYSWDYLYGMLNAQGALTQLLARGYDAVVLTYGQPGANGGSDYIQRNAFVAVACIQQMLSLRTGTAPLVIGGASMGGVIIRYALAYMEQHNLPHGANVFLSFDSPQQGANVPVSVQWFVQALSGESDGAAASAALLSSMAAQQMMNYYIPSYTYNGPLASALHTAFYQELAALGYPKQLTTVGISDGAGNGVQLIPDRAHVIDWHGNICAYGDTWAETTGSGKVAQMYCEPVSFWYEWSCSVKNCLNYDGAPGGTTPANGALAQQLIDSDYGSVDHSYDINCFIPTVSALDIAGATPYTPVPAQGAASAFNAYFVSDTNYAHVLITPQILVFLLAQIQPASAAAALPSRPAIPRGRRASTASPAYSQAAEIVGGTAPSTVGEFAISADGSTACALFLDGVYVFAQSQGTWALQTKIPVAEGRSVAVSDDGSVIAAVSAPNETATIYTGQNWSTATPLPLPAFAQGAYPMSIALSGDGTVALVGAPTYEGGAPGQAILFQWNGTAWTQAATFTGASSTESLFGLAVALSGDGTVAVVSGCTIVVQWPDTGFAYAFSGTSWATKTALPPAGAFQPGYGMECTANADGSVIVVAGVGMHAPSQNYAGTLFVFTGSQWQTRTAIPNPNTGACVFFGEPCLSADGTTLASIASDGGSTNVVYVFESSGSGWTLTATPPLPAATQQTTVGIAMDGDADTILVGAGASGMYALSGTDWTNDTLLAVSVDVAGLDFGAAIAVSGKGTATLIGAPGTNALVGAAYVYGPSGSGWTQLTAIASPDTSALAQFACDVALNANADTAAFGVRGDSSGAGCVYVFSGFNWSDQTRLTAATPTAGDHLGVSVALSADGTICVVGAPGSSANAGALYVFSGANWSQQVCLTATGGQSGDSLGMSVAVSSDGSVIVAGAPDANGGSGGAYVFSGTGWDTQTPIALSGSPTDAAFGASVAVSADGTTVLVGAPQINNEQGAAYVYNGTGWAQQTAITVASNPGDDFGQAVAISGDATVVLIGAPGANNGAGVAYTASGTGYGTVTTLAASDAAPGDGFGDAVAIDMYAETIVIGAPGRSYESGVVFVFTAATAVATEPVGAATMTAATATVAVTATSHREATGTPTAPRRRTVGAGS